MTKVNWKPGTARRAAQLTRIAALSVLPAVMAAGVFGQPRFFRDEEVKVVGEVQYGQTSDRYDFTNKPAYLGVHFDGNVGDRVDIKVTSIEGQAMAALTDSEFKPIVSTFGSHIAAALPPGPAPYPNRYFIIIREERGSPATFTVSLEKVGQDPATATKDYLMCSADSDCVAVPREGCCHNGFSDAVNKDRIDAYRAANACKLANPICPQFRVVEKRVAQCNMTGRQCEMMPPEQIRCGGTGDAAHACPAGYKCKGTGVAGIPGVCAEK